MPRRDPQSRAAYLRERRAEPSVIAERRWQARTLSAAWRELASRHRGEFAAILWEVRQQDPRPEAGQEQQRRGEAAHAA